MEEEYPLVHSLMQSDAFIKDQTSQSWLLQSSVVNGGVDCFSNAFYIVDNYTTEPNVLTENEIDAGYELMFNALLSGNSLADTVALIKRIATLDLKLFKAIDGELTLRFRALLKLTHSSGSMFNFDSFIDDFDALVEVVREDIHPISRALSAALESFYASLRGTYERLVTYVDVLDKIATDDVLIFDTEKIFWIPLIFGECQVIFSEDETIASIVDAIKTGTCDTKSLWFKKMQYIYDNNEIFVQTGCARLYVNDQYLAQKTYLVYRTPTGLFYISSANNL